MKTCMTCKAEFRPEDKPMSGPVYLASRKDALEVEDCWVCSAECAQTFVADRADPGKTTRITPIIVDITHMDGVHFHDGKLCMMSLIQALAGPPPTHLTDLIKSMVDDVLQTPLEEREAKLASFGDALQNMMQTQTDGRVH